MNHKIDYFIINLIYICLTSTISLSAQKEVSIEDITYDTILANEYLEEAISFYDSSLYEQSIVYYEKATNLYEKWKIWGKYVQSFNGVGKGYIELSKSDTALLYYEKNLPVIEQLLDKNHPELANFYYNLGVCLFNLEKYDSALKYYNNALDIWVETLGDHVDVAHAYSSIGHSYSKKRDFDQAIEYHTKALNVRKKVLIPFHQDIIIDHNNIGNSYWQKRDHKQALKHFQKAFHIRVKVFGHNHPDVAKSYVNIGNCSYLRGEYDNALNYYTKALKIRIKVLGKDHIDVAQSYNNIGICFSQKGDDKSARDYQFKALDIWIETFGHNHINVATCYSNIGATYEREGDVNQGLLYIRKALQIQKNIFNYYHPSIARSFNNIGIFYEKKDDFDKAIEQYTNAIEIYNKTLGINHLDLTLPYTNMGNCLISKGSYDKALEYHQKVCDIYNKNLGYDHPAVASSYNSIGNIYHHKGNYRQALDYINKALNIRLKTVGYKNLFVAGMYNNLGDNYSSIGDYTKALEHHQIALNIQTEILGHEDSHIDMAQTYNFLGNCHKQNKTYDVALEYYYKALKTWARVFGDGHSTVAGSYFNIGNIYYEKKNYNDALKHFEKALDVRIKVLGVNHPEIALSQLAIGLCYYKLENYNEALMHLQKSLKILCDTCVDMDSSSTIKLNNLISKPILLNVLKEKANVLLKKYTILNDESDLKSSFNVYQMATSLLDSLRFEFISSNSKQDLLDNSISVYDKAVYSAFKLHQQTQKENFLHNAFQTAEKSKAFLLLEALQNSQAKQFSNIPDSLTQKENDLKADIAYYEKRLFDIKTINDKNRTKQDSLDLVQYQDLLFDRNRQLENLIESFEKDHPQYYRLKYDLTVASVEDIQKKISTDQALIEYFVGDSSIFVFVIKQDYFDVKEIKKDFPLKEWVKTFRESISGLGNLNTNNNEFEKNAQIYAKTAFQLYDTIFAPIAEVLPEKLIIIPDGALNLIPFDALISTIPEDLTDFRSFDYLLNKYQISYNYSATLFKELIERKKESPNKHFIAFAPLFEDQDSSLANTNGIVSRSTFERLKHNIEEADTIVYILGGNAYTNNSATKNHFLQNVDKYNIVHLATHAKANDLSGDYSYIVFSETGDSTKDNQLLYVRELYNLNLSSDMIVLSACETGMGEIRTGEGIISLAHGFTYAGAESTVTSLWSVNDSLTKELMVYFYQNIKKGMSKDEALRQAKLTYLSLWREDFYINPYFWSSFIASGDMEPIRLKNNQKGWYIGMVTLVLVIVFYGQRFRKKRKRA